MTSNRYSALSVTTPPTYTQFSSQKAPHKLTTNGLDWNSCSNRRSVQMD